LGKRSNFKRIPRDLYRTIDPRAGDALARLLEPETRFIEPCAGHYDLAAQLIAHGHTCMDASDIKATPGVRRADALKLKPQPHQIITNPPWRRDLLHAMIMHFMQIAPAAWLLFDADWFHTAQAKPYLAYCTDYAAIGRLLWIPDTTMRGKDNAAWYRFTPHGSNRITAWPQQ